MLRLRSVLCLVTGNSDAQQAVIVCYACRWLGAASGDGLSEVTLTASSVDPRRALVEYQVGAAAAACICSSSRSRGTLHPADCYS